MTHFPAARARLAETQRIHNEVREQAAREVLHFIETEPNLGQFLAAGFAKAMVQRHVLEKLDPLSKQHVAQALEFDSLPGWRVVFEWNGEPQKLAIVSDAPGLDAALRGEQLPPS